MQKNNVYGRHLLVSKHQLQGEVVCEYLDCTFSEVTAAKYREELTRDTFINGLSSASMRQRLLENAEITLVQASELAESLDRAQRQSYVFGTVIASVLVFGRFRPTASIPQ